MNRAERLHSVLRDGRWHSHQEIKEAVGGMYFNNAATELRKNRGVGVEYKLLRGLPSYRLLTEPNTPRKEETVGAGGAEAVSTFPASDSWADSSFGSVNRSAPARVTDGVAAGPVQLSLAPPGAYEAA